jgi:ADP-heptose:LPS heptosyltransferase
MGRGHKGGRGHIRPVQDPFINVGVFRRGGLGDGFIETAVITGVKRHIPNSNITGYADHSFYSLLTDHPDCSSVRGVAWVRGMFTEVQVRNATIVTDNVDVWFDCKPVPFVDGRSRDKYVNTDHLGELADIESRYYRFNHEEIIDLYRRHECRGQPHLISKLIGIDMSIQDAHIQTEDPPESLKLPSSYATISAGWTETSHYKGWTVEGWSEVAHWLSEQGICPIQVGMHDEQEIPGTVSVRSLNLKQQSKVICGSDLHLGCDGFLCHLASAAARPTVVLWGPTPHEVWGHPGQVAVISPIARTIWWTHYHWAHDPACQEIMRAIQPDAVIDGIGQALGGGDAKDNDDG